MDSRKHRGPHPEDGRLFAEDQLPSMRQATSDLSWLLSRGYAIVSAIKLVGDRYRLETRPRLAVSRSACGDDQLESRRQRELSEDATLKGEVWIDGYNVLTSVEAALSGGVILVGRDGNFRDMASMHGNYRKVTETIPALNTIGETLREWGATKCRWFLDRPVSNSGRLKMIMGEVSREREWDWEIELVPDPDAILRKTDNIVASADSQILDNAEQWIGLARCVITALPSVWIVDLQVDCKGQSNH